MSFDEPKDVCAIGALFCASVSLMQVVLLVTYAGISRFERSESHDRK